MNRIIHGGALALKLSLLTALAACGGRTALPEDSNGGLAPLEPARNPFTIACYGRQTTATLGTNFCLVPTSCAQGASLQCVPCQDGDGHAKWSATNRTSGGHSDLRQTYTPSGCPGMLLGAQSVFGGRTYTARLTAATSGDAFVWQYANGSYRLVATSGALTSFCLGPPPNPSGPPGTQTLGQLRTCDGTLVQRFFPAGAHAAISFGPFDSQTGVRLYALPDSSHGFVLTDGVGQVDPNGLQQGPETTQIQLPTDGPPRAGDPMTAWLAVDDVIFSGRETGAVDYLNLSVDGTNWTGTAPSDSNQAPFLDSPAGGFANMTICAHEYTGEVCLADVTHPSSPRAGDALQWLSPSAATPIGAYFLVSP